MSLYPEDILIMGTNGSKSIPIVVDDDGNLVFDRKVTTDLPVVAKDTSFVTGDSPADIDVNTALGRNGTWFEVINDGPGDIDVSWSVDGVIFSDPITRKQQETLPIENISIDTIRIIWVANSAYRVTSL